MSTASLLVVVAVTWSSVGFAVALLLGRIFRDANPVSEEIAERLIC